MEYYIIIENMEIESLGIEKYARESFFDFVGIGVAFLNLWFVSQEI